MRKILQALFIAGLMLNITTLFAQEKISNENKIYQVKELLDDKFLNVQVKEYFVKEIRKTELVKPIDNHEFVHFYIERFNSTYKSLIKTELLKYKTTITQQQGKILVNKIIAKMAIDFDAYRLANPNQEDDNTIIDVNLFKLGAGTGSDTYGAGQPCNNSDFETGDCTGWEPIAGSVTGAAPYSFNSAGATTCGASAHHVIVTGGTDPNGGFPMVFPGGGGTSLMIGDAMGTGNGAAKIRQTFLVDAGSAAFSYSYAVVLNDAGHTTSEQPYFKVNMFDAGGNPIVCADYSVVAPTSSGSDPDFISYPGGFYSDWRTAFAPLDTYIGQNVTIEFLVGDCSQGGHYGYAYLDASCDPLQIIPSQTVICGGQPVTLTAPAGATSYAWTPGGQTTQSITTNVPGHYEVFVTPVTGSACGLTLMADIGGSPDYPVAQFTANPTTVCVGTPIDFTNSSYVVGTSSIDSVKWDFDANGITDNTTSSPTYTYPVAGNYTPTLTVYNNGCIHDTTLNIAVIASPTANFTAPPVCQGVATSFTNTSTPAASITNWNWDFDNNGSFDNTNQNPTNTFATAGTYPVNMQVTLAGGSCPKDTTINIIVNPNPVANFTGTDECLNTATTFTDASTVSSGSITGWAWDFDNNTTTDNTTQNPTNTYTAAGTQTVNLTVTSDSGCTNLFSTTVQVYNNPVANFSTDVACENFVTTFTDLSVNGTGIIDTWQWDFDNNATIDNLTQNPTNTYTSDGTFPVTFTVTDGNNCTHDTTIDIIVAPQPTSAFSFTNVCFGTTTGFTDLSNGNGGTINQWGWDFTNNGSVDNITQNPSNGYTSAGSYTVELHVTTTDGCKDSTTMLVAVDPIPVANFSGTNECFGFTTTFIDSSNVATGTVVAWDWNFGDIAGGTSAVQNPTYNYTSAGTYNVTITVTSDSGCISNFNTNVEVYNNPVANFVTDTACSTLVTTFTDLTTLGNFGIQTWYWDYDGDGLPNDSLQNPTYIFAGAGTYPVNLSVVDTFGCVHDTTLNVIVSENPIANFTHSNECYGTATTFTDLSNNNGGTTNIDTWGWDYDGNGTIDNATQNPTNIFSSAGTYQTELFITSTLGCKDSMTIAVVVNPIPVADFTATSECLEYTTMFTNNSTITTGTITQNDWNFDDGSLIDNNIDPTHIYGSSGTFNVNLEVTSDSGCTHNVTIPVIVYPKPTAAFTTADICQNLTAQFTNQSIDNGGTINQWDWDIDFDGVNHTTDYTTINATNNYAVANTYIVELIVTTIDGCKDTVSNPITIHPMPIADFTYINDCVNAGIDFTNTSTVSSGTVDTWAWQFGDTQTSALANPTNNYATEGVYDVKLLVTTNNNCKDSIVKNGIEVWPLPDVDFSPTSVCLNDSTPFLDLSTVSSLYTANTNVAWDWNFGDGIGTSNVQHPIYMYTSDGVFQATLSVTTNHNCIYDTTIDVTVHPLPVVDFAADIREGCTPVDVQFTDNTEILTDDGSFINQWAWDFNGDGITDDINQNPPNPFNNPSHSSVRDFDIRLITTSNFGCKDTLVKADYIHSYPIPLASFMYWPNDEASIVDNEIAFTDQSIIGSVFNWDLGDGTLTNVQHPVHEFADTGFYLITLAIENVYSCRDTTEKYVNIKPIYAIYIPNSFTPNGDNTNDYFYVNGYGIKELQMMIFDRWGMKLYDDIGVEQSWDGVYKGNLVPTDVYVYKVRAKDVFDEWHDYIGKVTVIK